MNTQMISMLGPLILLGWAFVLKSQLKVKNTQLQEATNRLDLYSFTDPLTKLSNYTYFLSCLNKSIHHAYHQNKKLSLIKLDIDLFKNINTIYGTDQGDTIFIEFAQFLKEVIRKQDTVARLKDDEFGIICRESDRQETIQFAHRIKEHLKQKRFGRDHLTLQLSIGIVTYPDDATCENTLLWFLERCVEYSKEHSGSVISFEQLRHNLHICQPELAETQHSQMLREQISKLRLRLDRTTIEAIIALANTIKAKDSYTAEHTDHTMLTALTIAEDLLLDPDQIVTIKYAAILHDLGKIGIHEDILKKPGKLTEREFDEIKKHPLIGSEILRPLHCLSNILPAILYHHERIDGSGYPYGLKGTQIPIEAQIISISDCYQALISPRPYRKAYSQKTALGIIQSGNGTQFFPKLVDAFIHAYDKPGSVLRQQVT